MKLLYYRVFVARTSQLSLPLFSEGAPSKSDLIFKAFSSFSQAKPLYFSSGDRQYAYAVHKIAPPYIYANLAKLSQVKVQHSPEEGFKTESMDDWPHIPLIINTSDNPQQGQSIAIELNKAIFQHPQFQIRRLITELNAVVLREYDHEMALHPITEQGDFWAAVKQHEGSIKAIQFEFSAPNLFGTRDKLNDELRDARDDLGMTKTTIKVENSEGDLRVPNTNNFMQQGVKYVADGGGDYKIQLTQRRTLTSGDSVKSKEVEETELTIAASQTDTLKDFCDTLFSWLKH